MIPAQNLAVVARRFEPADSLDFFPTPPWATRALFETVPGLMAVSLQSWWDPCCGQGHMIEVVKEQATGKCIASDIFDYGYGAVGDFLNPQDMSTVQPDWIIMNHPFNQTCEFITRALTVSNIGIAFLCRTQALEGVKRYRQIWAKYEPIICPFVERVPMYKGRWVVNGSTATAYMWVILSPYISAKDAAPCWIKPGAKARLSKPDDPVRFNGVYRRREIVGHDDDGEPIREDVFYSPAEWQAMGRAA